MEMSVDGVRAEEELTGDLRVGKPFRQQAQDLYLAACELGKPASAATGRAASGSA